MAFTVITALPTPPQSTDTQAVFEARADAEIAALNPFITQTNTLAVEFNTFSKTLGFSFIGRSLTSQNIALGLLNFTLDPNLGYAVGNYLKIAAAIAPSNNMYGTVTAYSVTTGAMSISVETKTGTGTFSDWVFSLSAPANGAIGGTEFVVATGTSSAYTITPTNIISIYKEGLAWDIKFPVACIDSPVAAISGLANTNIVILASDGTYQNCAARDIIIGSISTLQLVDAGGGTLKLWLKDPAVEHTRLSVITADTPLTITNSLGKVIKSSGGAIRIITLPVFSTFPIEGVIEIFSENATSLQLVRQNAADVIDFYGINPPTDAVSGAFLDVPYQTYLKIIRNNANWQITTAVGQSQTPSFKNKLINGKFRINQRAVTGTVTLTAGIYGHDRFKAGAAGCTYTFATVQNVTTITITAGSLIQVIEADNLETAIHTLSWQGTAQGKIGAGAFSASGVTGAVVGGANLNIEFNIGTLTKVQLEQGALASLFEIRSIWQEEMICFRYFERIVHTSGNTLMMNFTAGGQSNGFSFGRVAKRVTPTAVINTSTGSNGTLGAFATSGTYYGLTINSTAAGLAYATAFDVSFSAEL